MENLVILSGTVTSKKLKMLRLRLQFESVFNNNYLTFQLLMVLLKGYVVTIYSVSTAVSYHLSLEAGFEFLHWVCH